MHRHVREKHQGCVRRRNQRASRRLFTQSQELFPSRAFPTAGQIPQSWCLPGEYVELQHLPLGICVCCSMFTVRPLFSVRQADNFGVGPESTGAVFLEGFHGMSMGCWSYGSSMSVPTSGSHWSLYI